MKRYLKCVRAGEIRSLLCKDDPLIQFGCIVIYSREGYELANIDDPSWELWTIIDESILKESR